VLRQTFTVIFLCAVTTSWAQTGGRYTFEFLNVPGTARLSALGGVNVSLTDRDINFFFANPALTGDSLAGTASANYQFYLANIGHASFAYSHTFNKVGTITFGVQHIGYGNIKSYDASGQETGSFSANETQWAISKSHQVGHFRLGANLKFAFSNLAGFRANALIIDLGGVFIHPEQDLRVGLTVRNAGFFLSRYSATSNSSLPFDVQAGVSFKPEHMPFRFSITAYHLTRSSLVYDDPANDEKPGTLDKVLRRFNFGAELLLHRNVNILVGYNYLVHQELKQINAGGSAGLSFGFSVKVRSTEFVFSRSSYVVGTAGYAFTFSANIDKLLKRRT
jgi:hypothetical protein